MYGVLSLRPSSHEILAVPVIRGHPVNTANFFWHISDRILKRGSTVFEFLYTKTYRFPLARVHFDMEGNF